MKKAVIYARVSTAEQAEAGYSIDAQLETVKNRIEQGGKVVIDSYVDRGISGKSIEKRLSLQQLLKDAKEGRFDEVWVWKTNRLARNHLDLLKIVEELGKHNVYFKSCSEHFDTTTTHGRLMMSILASISEFERETIVDNVKMGMKQRARLGKWNGGQVLEYASVEDPNAEGKTKLEIVKKEVLIIQDIFKLYSEGNGFKSITNKVNKSGYKTKKGNLFSISGIKEILLNPIYIGKIRYNYRENWTEKRRKGINKNPIIVDAEHKAIITDELWTKVQTLYRERSHKPNRIYNGSYPLTGLIKCPVCKASMVAGRTKRKLKNCDYTIYRYYQCGAWRNKGIAACSSNSVKADIVEKLVFEKIKQVLLNESLLNDIVQNINNNKMKKLEPLERQLNELDKQIQGNNNKKKKWFELYEESIISKEDLSNRLETISDELQMQSKHKETIQAKLRMNNSDPVDINMVRKFMNKFDDVINNANYSKKKIVLNAVIDQIILNKNREVESISLKFNDKNKRILQIE